MKRRHLVATFAAAALFAWVISHVSFATMAEQLRAMRTALPLVLILSMLRLLLQTITWSASLEGKGVSVDKRRLMGVRLASQSMGYLTVLGPAVSEPMKINLLGTASQPTIIGTFLDDGVYWFTSVLLAITGVAALPLKAVCSAACHTIPIFLLLAFTLVVIRRRSPILSGAVRALGTHVPSWLSRAENLEASIRTYRLAQPALVRRMFCIDLACQGLTVSEIVVVLWSLHLPRHCVAILAIAGITGTVKMLSGWIPARLGSDEGGAISAFALVGFSPMLGLSLALTRRVRDLLWALIGILWLAWNSRRPDDRSDTRGSRPATVIEEALKCKQS